MVFQTSLLSFVREKIPWTEQYDAKKDNDDLRNPFLLQLSGWKGMIDGFNVSFLLIQSLAIFQNPSIMKGYSPFMFIFSDHFEESNSILMLYILYSLISGGDTMDLIDIVGIHKRIWWKMRVIVGVIIHFRDGIRSWRFLIISGIYVLEHIALLYVKISIRKKTML